MSKEEYYQRRVNFMERLSITRVGSDHQNHIVIIPSAARSYMTHDIPYWFRQNTDFLYLCGFQEPDSILVLESDTDTSLPSFRSTIFVPKRDPAKELWEGERSGIKGSIYLTGIENAYDIEHFAEYLFDFVGEHTSCSMWYNFLKPPHPEFHTRYIQDLAVKMRSRIHSPVPIVQSLRALKSEAELSLMQESCDIASNAFKEVMKFSYPQVLKFNNKQICGLVMLYCHVKCLTF